MPGGTWNHPDASNPAETDYTDSTTYGTEVDLTAIAAAFMEAFRQRARVCRTYRYGSFQQFYFETPWPNVNSTVSLLGTGYPFNAPGSGDAALYDFHSFLLGRASFNSGLGQTGTYVPTGSYSFGDPDANMWLLRSRDLHYESEPSPYVSRGAPLFPGGPTSFQEWILSDTWWLQSAAWMLAAYFCAPDLQTIINEETLEETREVAGLLRSDFPWPSPGFTRKYPREIYTLLQAGEEGQIARFVVWGNAGGGPSDISIPSDLRGSTLINPSGTDLSSGWAPLIGDDSIHQSLQNSPNGPPFPPTSLLRGLSLSAASASAKLRMNTGLLNSQLTPITLNSVTRIKIYIYHATDATAVESGGITTSVDVNVAGSQLVVDLDAGQSSSGWVTAIYAGSWTQAQLNSIRITIASDRSDAQITQKIHAMLAQVDYDVDESDDPAAFAFRFAVPLSGTPGDEFPNAGTLMRHTAGEWIPWTEWAAGQGGELTPPTGPDTVEKIGLPRGGDYFGPWVLNDLRRALNMMTATYGGTAPLFPGPLATVINIPWVGNNLRVSFQISFDELINDEQTEILPGSRRFKVVGGPTLADGLAREVDFYFHVVGEAIGTRKFTVGPFTRWEDCVTPRMFMTGVEDEFGFGEVLDFAIARWDVAGGFAQHGSSD